MSLVAFDRDHGRLRGTAGSREGEEAGRPAPPPLKARLIANKESYTLPTGGKTLDEYRKHVGTAGNAMEMPSALGRQWT